MSELLDHMQIGRQSLYDTFGDKRQLYVEAFKHYSRNNIDQIVQSLFRQGSSLANIRDVMNQIAAEVNDGRCCGCFLTNTLVENAQQDPEIAAVTTAAIRRLEQGFKKALTNAMNAGEVPENSNVRALARFFVNTVQGMVVMGKATSNRSSAREVVDVALSVLEG